MERGTPPFLEMEGQNIGRVGEKIAAKIFAHLGLRELGEILGQLLFRRCAR